MRVNLLHEFKGITRRIMSVLFFGVKWIATVSAKKEKYVASLGITNEIRFSRVRRRYSSISSELLVIAKEKQP